MPPSDPLRVAVIGVGYLGAFHAEKYAALPDVTLKCVFDTDAPRAAVVAEKNGCRVAADIDDALADVDAVSVAVPTAAHAAVGQAAARAGVHMLVEKPLTADSASGRALVAAAAEAGVLLQVGHLERFNPVLADVHSIVADPRFIECHRLSPFAGRGGDTDVVHDVMIHDLDIIAYLVDRPLVAVDAVGVPVLSGQVDIANARLRFEGGCTANVTASRVSLKRERKLRIFQQDAYASVDFDERRVLVARRKDTAPADIASNPMDAIDIDERQSEEGRNPPASQLFPRPLAPLEGRIALLHERRESFREVVGAHEAREMRHQVVERRLIGLVEAHAHHPLGGLYRHRRIGGDFLCPRPSFVHELIIRHYFVKDAEFLALFCAERLPAQKDLCSLA